MQTKEGSDTIVHPAPMWRDRANFIVFADIHHPRMSREWEQLWARKITEGLVEICCIPFFVYDLALADQVEVGPAKGKRYVVQKLVHPSGRFAFRIWLGKSSIPRDELANRLIGLGGQVEPYSNNMVAVDAPNRETAKVISNFLAGREAARELIYETARR